MNWYDERKKRIERMADDGMTTQEIADYYGLTVQTVDRILSGYYAAEGLRKEGQG